MHAKRKLFAGLASLTLFDIAAAGAADMAVKARPKAPVPTPVVYNWVGPYIGAHAGYRWADVHFTGPADPDLPFSTHNDKIRPDGGIIGGHLGYNMMLSPTVLAGIEGDWTWGSKRDRAVSTSNDGLRLYSSEVKLTWQATIRGRLGWVNGPWLFYGTGGVAFIHADWRDSVSGFITGVWTDSTTRTGWTIGGGIEHIYNPTWLVRIEYLYENFGSFHVPHGFVPPAVGTLDIDAHKLRVGISYRFGGWR